MDTYVQDTVIPIYIILQYDWYVLKFPVNPESIKKEIGSSSTTEEIEGIGQISVPKKPDLARITIESFFWQTNPNTYGDSVLSSVQSSMYVAWLEAWQKSKKPAKLIVTRLNYSMEVTCESFTHWINAGEEKDIYFTLELQEYRPHGAKKLGAKTNETLMQRYKKIEGFAYSPVLVEIPRPTRNSSSKKTFTNPYTVLENETLTTITKKITGSTDDWELLYKENKETLGEIFEESDSIPTGTKLVLPDEWVNNSSYNIVQEL